MPVILSVSNVSKDPISRDQTLDRWGLRRIWIAGASGALLAGTQWILDFWPLDASGSLGGMVRTLCDLSRVLFLLPLAAFVVGLLIAAGVALWHRHFRKVGSSLLAIAAVPVCVVVVARVPLFDPWLWYAMANSSRFEALATSHPLSTGPVYAVIEGRDVSTGLVGLSPNHFVFLIYDESDAVGLAPSERPSIWRTRTMNSEFNPAPPVPRGKHLYGHFFRVDEFD